VYTGNADAEADARFAAGAANPESDVEAMAGELKSKWLHGADGCDVASWPAWYVPSIPGIANASRRQYCQIGVTSGDANWVASTPGLTGPILQATVSPPARDTQTKQSCTL
jgi:hypothetical protein